MTHMDKKAWNDYIKNELQKRRVYTDWSEYVGDKTIK